MCNIPLVASTANLSTSPIISTQVYTLTKAMVKCSCSYMGCARFPRRYTVEGQTLRGSLDGLELHLHVPKQYVYQHGTDCQSLSYSKKFKELRSSATKSCSTSWSRGMAPPTGTNYR